MTKLSNYQLNTDFTAIKTLSTKYTATINIAAGSVSDRQQWSQEVSIPDGEYTTMSLISINGLTYSDIAARNFGGLVIGAVDIYAVFQRISINKMRLLAEADVSGGGSGTVPAIVVSGSMLLSPSPFS